MITFSQRVHVPHPPEIVWGVLSDPEQCVRCVDGSTLGERHEDGSFDAALAVKFAGIKVTFKAVVALTLDDETRTGRLDGKGGDKRGSTRVTGGADYTVVPEDGGSLVTLDGSADVKGPLSGLITTGASLVVDRMAKSFTEKLVATCDELDPAGKDGK